jgi:hypothetical protein
MSWNKNYRQHQGGFPNRTLNMQGIAKIAKIQEIRYRKNAPYPDGNPCWDQKKVPEKNRIPFSSHSAYS